MEGSVELARQHWEEGYRRIARTKEPEPRLYARLLDQVEIVSAELRRRLGKSFTLDELAAAYAGSDRWAREAVEERGGDVDWLASTSTAADAAFHLYARGARDYRP
ncbi:MAG TPA: hypothetical protein VLJ76_10910 [Gaiellaceae bacterium]|nr:hypothetical protein [Gaiellaceae bacterium]